MGTSLDTAMAGEAVDGLEDAVSCGLSLDRSGHSRPPEKQGME